MSKEDGMEQETYGSEKRRIVIRVVAKEADSPAIPVANAEVSLSAAAAATGQRNAYLPAGRTDAQGGFPVELDMREYTVTVRAFGLTAPTQTIKADDPGCREVVGTIPLGLTVRSYVVGQDCKRLPCDEVTSGAVLRWQAELSRDLRPLKVNYEWTFTGCTPFDSPASRNSDVVYTTTAGFVGKGTAQVTIREVLEA
jgi:hypothetical protein